MTSEPRDAPQFYLTSPSPCPYLPGKEERKVFTHLVGRRAPKLEGLRFAVLGLGDSSYAKFCEIGRVIDARLAELGGRRVAAFGEADVDVDTVAVPWRAIDAKDWIGWRTPGLSLSTTTKTLREARREDRVSARRR